MKRFLLLFGLLLIIGLVIGLTGCSMIEQPIYNPPLAPIPTIPATPTTTIVSQNQTVTQNQAIPTVTVIKPTPVPIIETTTTTVTPITPIIETNVVALPVASFALPQDASQDGIGRPLKQIQFRIAWLKTGDLLAIESSPIYNASDDNKVYSLTYGIFETRPDIQPAPDYFKNFVKTYSLVNVPGKSWVDVPITFDIPKGTQNLPTSTVYFNIAIHDTASTGSLQWQAAERWEITFN